MDEKKLKNDKLLDIPDFLRRLDENRSENAPEVAEQPVEEKTVEEKPKAEPKRTRRAIPEHYIKVTQTTKRTPFKDMEYVNYRT